MRKLFAPSLGFLLLALPALAQTNLPNPLGPSGQTIPQVIGVFIRFIIGFIGSGALLMFVWGGFKFILARGDQKEVAEAKQIMTWATYGLVIIFLSFAIVSGITGALTSAGAQR